MTKYKLTLQLRELKLAVCRLPAKAALPRWVAEDSFVSITRTSDELSIVCSERHVPLDVKAERNWRMIKVKGPIDFSLTGILASLLSPLADSGIPIFAISTYDTDYLLLKEKYFVQAIGILEQTCIIENKPLI